MSSKAAQAMYPNLADGDRAERQGKLPNDTRAAWAMYGKPEPEMAGKPIRGNVPVTYENLSRVPGLKPIKGYQPRSK